jgi:hypothetical protein
MVKNIKINNCYYVSKFIYNINYKETGPPGLGTAVACREQEARWYRTTRDRPRGL